MKNLFNLFVIFIFVFPTLLLAQGFDLGDDPTTPSVIKISDEQRNDINIKRIIKLTKSQMKLIAPSWNTVSLGIISEEWNESTAGMLYAVWSDPNELTIPAEVIKLERNKISDFDLLDFLRKSIIMDRTGLFYRDGKQIKLDSLKKESMSSHRGITINVPGFQVLDREKRNNYLKKLTDMGIVYEIFG